MALKKLIEKRDSRSFLDGQMLVAMPGMTDTRFARSVVYLCAHSADGAMGIVVNRPAQKTNFRDLLVQLKVIEDDNSIILPPAADNVQVLSGGPVDKNRGFVLHSTDFVIGNSSLPVNDDVALTITMDILKAIAGGTGPEKAIVALGYAGWSPGQLEREIQENGWLNCPADARLIFDPDHTTKYDRAMRSIGIDPRMLSAEAGHA